MKKSRVTVTRDVLIACAGAAVGATLMGVLGPAVEPAPVTARVVAPVIEQAPRADRARLSAAGCGHAAHEPAAASAARPAHAAATAEGGALDELAMTLVDRTLAAERRVAEGDHDEAAHEADAAYAALAAALATDPRAVERVAARFRDVRDPLEAEVLAAVLGQFRDPAVEQAALEVATNSPDAGLRVAGFDLLDALDLPAARDAALTAIDRESDPAVRRAALHALPPPDGASLAEAAEVVGRLVRVLRTDRDVEARRRAARGLGDWCQSDEAREALVAALRGDAAPEVRAGAAFGLERARAGDPQVRAALVGALGDDDDLVRENAWRALGVLAPLPPAEHAAWLAYRDVIEGQGEAEGF